MKHIRINAGQILEDIRTGMSDGALMEKYGLSVRSLPKVKAELQKLGLIAPGELSCSNGCPVSEKISINARDFVKAFRESPDDFTLMNKYSLKPGHLQRVYRQLLAKGLLTEYEFHHRERKSPELQSMELPEIDETTAVDLTEELSGRLKNYHKIGTVLPGTRSVKRPSRIEGGPLEAAGLRGTPQEPCTESPTGPCPQCGKPKVKEFPDTCQFCGVVFAKLKGDKKRSGAAIWY
jgi:hypothetical protein